MKKFKRPYRKHPPWAREFIRRARGDDYRYETICEVCDNDYSIEEIKNVIRDINTIIALGTGTFPNRVYNTTVKILKEIIEYKGGELTTSEINERLRNIEYQLSNLPSIEENRVDILELRKEHWVLSHKLDDIEVFEGNSSRGIYIDSNGKIKTVDLNEYETSYIIRDSEGIILDEGYEFEEDGIYKDRSNQEIYEDWEYWLPSGEKSNK
jgi:hypothetical protein